MDEIDSFFVLMQEVIGPCRSPPVKIGRQWVQHDCLCNLLNCLARLARMDQRIPEVEEQVSKLRVEPFGFAHHGEALVDTARIKTAGAELPITAGIVRIDFDGAARKPRSLGKQVWISSSGKHPFELISSRRPTQGGD